VYARLTIVKKKHAARMAFVLALDAGNAGLLFVTFKKILQPPAFFWPRAPLTAKVP
jgi:hypothetical protein